MTYSERSTGESSGRQSDKHPAVMFKRPDWDKYFLNGAAWAATRADCTRRQVGAILVNARNEVRGVGYNGAPSGIPGCATASACPRGAHYETVPSWAGDTACESELCDCDSTKGRECACGAGWPCAMASAPGADYANCIADHAERNALRHANPAELAGSTLYVTDEPCPSCWTLIRAAGILRVVTPNGDFAP